MKFARQVLVVLPLIALFAVGCATSSPIQRFSESESHFRKPPELNSHDFPPSNVYRIYHRAATGFVSVQSIREAAEERIQRFATTQGRSYIVLGERISQPPYILGNFPRIEIVFALTEEERNSEQRLDKYAQLERLKELLDQGVLTEEEFETEKDKVLQ